MNGHTTTHVWDRGSIILEMNGSGAVMNRFSRGVGHLIRSYHHGFYLFNARMDVVQRVDSDGDILHTYRYDAFGNQLNGDSVNTNPFRFAAEYYDFETGFIYLRARFYNPAIGRFISEDPYWTIFNMQSNTEAILQSANLFVFVMNNPVRFIDPSGMVAIPAPIKQEAGRIFGKLLQRVVEVAAVAWGIEMARNASAPTISTTTAAPHNPANPPTTIVGGQPPPTAVDATMEQVHSATATSTAASATAFDQQFWTAEERASMASAATAAELEGIAREYGNLQCEKAKNAMADFLTKNNKRFEEVRMVFAGRAGVISFILESAGFTGNISENGIHWGIAYGGRIHCNIHPAGLPESVWVNDFWGVGGLESISPPRLRSLRRLP